MSIKRRFTKVSRIAYHRQFGGGLRTPPLRDRGTFPPWPANSTAVFPITLPDIKHNYNLHRLLRKYDPIKIVIGLMFAHHRAIDFDDGPVKHGYERQPGFTTYLAVCPIVAVPGPVQGCQPTYKAVVDNKLQEIELLEAFGFRKTVLVPPGAQTMSGAFIDPKVYALQREAVNDLYRAAEDAHEILMPWKHLKGR